MNLKISKREGWIITITLLSGLLIGWLIFGRHHGEMYQATGHEGHQHEIQSEAGTQGKTTIWTCAMHPQIRMDKPGKCPICSMDLIPLEQSKMAEEELTMGQVQMSQSAIGLANIQTTKVVRQSGTKEIHLLGKVKADERNIAQLTARFGGRIEKLFVNYTGQEVRKGEPLALIYSPELVTAQKELLEAKKYQESNPEFFNAAKNKLKFWDLTKQQIESILEKEEVRYNFEVLSPINGTVTMLHVALGNYVKTGASLFRVVDLSRVWVLFEAYETDLPWIQKGDQVEFVIRSLPGKNFKGRVSFVDPIMNPKSRIANVRVELKNPGLLLKPEMYADGVLQSNLSEKGKSLVVPKTAVLWTGKRAVVYVKVPHRNQPVFEYREIMLGPEAGNYFMVHHGLEKGEEVVTNGVFKVDAAAQLAGKSSMMNPEGGAAAMGHHHGAMGGKKSNHKQHTNSPQSVTSDVSPKFRSQMDAVFRTYLDFKEAFVASDPQQARTKAEVLLKELHKVEMGLLKGEAHMLWMKQLKQMQSAIESIKVSSDLEAQRIAFAQFVDAFIPVMEKLGSNQKKVFLQFCPMAKEGAGAFWLSDSKEIRNPYYGKAMIGCGETRRNLAGEEK